MKNPPSRRHPANQPPKPAVAEPSPPTERQLDQALAETFPASDPISVHSEGAEPRKETQQPEQG